MKITALFSLLLIGAPSFAQIKVTKLFADPSVILQLGLKSDFAGAKAAASEGGMITPDRDQPKYLRSAEIVDLNNPGLILSGQVRARGMSNLWEGESEFPKLRVEIDKDQSTKNTIFEGNRKFKLNTHVATNPVATHTDMGRLQGEAGPFREALGYDLARALELPALATQRARIRYTETSTNVTFTRNALVLETDKNFAERTGNSIVENHDFVSDIDSKIDPVLGAKFFLFNALIGNGDIGLKVNEQTTMSSEYYRPVFNTTIFQNSKGVRFPIVYDFDLATLVTGSNENMDNFYVQKNFGLTANVGRIAYDIINLRHRFTEQQLRTAIDYYKTKKSELIQIVKLAAVDDEGRKIALSQVEGFYQAADIAMKLSLVTSEGIHFYDDINRSVEKIKIDPTTDAAGALRLGTPVRILSEDKARGLFKVEIIDMRFDLAEGQSSIGYIENSTPISSQFPADQIGKIDERDTVAY